MPDKNKDTESFTWLGKYLLYNYFVTVLPRAIFRTQPKVYAGAFLQKKNPTINVRLCSKNSLLPVKVKETNYRIWFYIICYNFINFPVFIDIKQTLHYEVAIEYNQGDVYFLCVVALCLSPITLLGKVFYWLF